MTTFKVGQRFSVNRDTLVTNRLFLKACELAKTPPTKRQASKYRNGYGKAHAKRDEALYALQHPSNGNGNGHK